MPIHPILRAIYYFLKALVLSSFNIFFSKTKIINRQLLHFQNPAIVVSNHPNTLQDPLNVAARVKKFVFFLANASLFKAPLAGKILSTLYCIPVERPKDVQGRSIRNDDNFAKASAFLSSGGCLYIAPEGVSDPARRLNTIKTGTARIALRAERENNFSLGLTIVPVGLSYTAPTQFRSKVVIHVGAPILVIDYQSIYEKDARAAVKKLTADLHDRLSSLILDTADVAEDELLTQLQIILQSNEPLPLEANYYRSKELLKKLQLLRSENGAIWKNLSITAHDYFTALHERKLQDERITEDGNKRSLSSLFGQAVYLIVVFPLFLYALVNHFFANFIPAYLVRRLNLYVGYTATVKILAGLFTYPIFYGLQIYWVHHYFEQSMFTLLYVASLLLAAPFYFWYKRRSIQWFDRIRKHQLSEDQLASLQHKRKEVVHLIKQYLFSLSNH